MGAENLASTGIQSLDLPIAEVPYLFIFQIIINVDLLM
jgi:hypothetical protein